MRALASRDIPDVPGDAKVALLLEGGRPEAGCLEAHKVGLGSAHCSLQTATCKAGCGGRTGWVWMRPRYRQPLLPRAEEPLGSL